MNDLRLQYGCGFHAPAGWRNFDASPTLRFERLPLIGKAYARNGQRFPSNVEYGDIVKGLPLPQNSCGVIFASHVLEHLSLRDFQTALRHTYELLVPGGVFRLIVPDLETLAHHYLSSSQDEAAKVFMEETSLGVVERARGIGGLMQTWLGNSSHLWMWDFKSMRTELISAGFIDIEKCRFGDNPIFADVEQADRFTNCLAVECRRPL